MSEIESIRQRFDAALPAEFEWDEREVALLAIADRQASRLRELDALLEEQGLMVPGSTGQPRLNPIVQELRLQEAALVRTIEGIRLPDESGEANKSVRHQRAANRRWKGAA